MSYSEEQQGAYSDVQFRLGEFDKIKEKIKTLKCSEHQRKCKVSASWEEEYEVHVYIEKYCCPGFASQIAGMFEKEELFNEIFIVPSKEKTETSHLFSEPFTLNDYNCLIKQYNFDETPLAIYGGEQRMGSFIPIEQADIDLKIYVCKVILKRCFSATLGDLVFVWDYEWFIKQFFSSYRNDHLKPGLSEAIREAANMIQLQRPFTTGIIATTFLFGVIEFYIKYELGFRPHDFDFFDDSKKTYYHKYFDNKKKIPRELSIGKGIEILMKEKSEIASALNELQNHNLQRLKSRNIDPGKRWIYPELSKRLSLFRNTMLHGELHSFYSVGSYLLMLYCLFHLCHEKESKNKLVY